MIKKAKQQSLGKVEQGQHIQHEVKESLRLNKYISDSGHSSRREADRLIEAGRVTIDGEKAVVGTRVLPSQIVAVDGHQISSQKDRVYIALHKPVGIVSTTDTEVPGNLTDFMDYPEHIFPIGRLDKESTGLLLLTNDGDIVNKILREEYGHDKEYLVSVDKEVTPKFIRQMSQGVEIFNLVANERQVTKRCKVEQIGKQSFKMTLQQGLNRQIRRMTQALDYKVTSLKRLRVMTVSLGNLGEGQWRYLTEKELIEMNQALSQNKK